MAKKKTEKTKAPEVQAAETAAPEAAAKENSAYLNRVPASLIHDSKSKPGVKIVSIPDQESATGYSSIFAKSTQVFPAQKFDPETNKPTGVPVPNMFNVVLGKESRQVQVSRAVDSPDGGIAYQNVNMSAKDLAGLYKDNQTAYYNKINAEREAAKTVQAEDKSAQADGPEV